MNFNFNFNLEKSSYHHGNSCHMNIVLKCFRNYTNMVKPGNCGPQRQRWIHPLTYVLRPQKPIEPDFSKIYWDILGIQKKDIFYVYNLFTYFMDVVWLLQIFLDFFTCLWENAYLYILGRGFISTKVCVWSS